MQSIQHQLNVHRAKSRRLKKWKKIVTALACVVVFCTVYALILPAITLEGNTYCDKEEHTHSDACYKEAVVSTEKKLVCEKEEVEPHTHSDGCYEIRTVEVPVEETIEVPADEAEPAAASETGDAEPTVASEADTGAEPAAASETPAMKTVTVTRMETKEEKVLVCEKEETEGHAHSDGCYDEVEVAGEKELDCDKEEHKHSKSCYANPNADVETEADWEKTFEDVTFTHDWVEDTLAIAKSQLGYNESNDNYIILENGDTKGYTRYGDWYGNKYGDWCAMFVSFCLDYAEVEDFPLEAGCQNWILKIKDLEEASKDEEGVVQYNAWQEATDDYIPERGNIIFFNWDSAPDSDHVGIVVGTTTDENGNTTITTIEGNTSDTVKYKEYKLESSTIMGYGILPAQEFYCGMKGHAHDEDCYDDANKLICETEEHIHTEECEVPSELTEEEQAEVAAVIAAIDALPTADEFDAKLLEYEDAEDMEGYEAYWLEVQTACQEAYAMYEALSEELKAYVTNIDKLMELEWLWSVETYVEIPDKIDSDPVTVTESASTSDFVELNVFDYYGNRGNKPAGMMDINYRWQSVALEYPGYQWNAGAYPYRYYKNETSSYGWIADRNLVDCIDFGNSLITDYEITDSLYVPNFNKWINSANAYGGDASSSRISVASSTGANGAINAIDWGNNTGNTDRPVGYSSKFGLSIGNKLGADGYPELKNNAKYGKSLKYLFYDDLANNYVYADKKNSVSVDGLFQQDPVSGEYYFDSRRNHAQYDDVNDRFVLYDQTITPNFILYPFGNFLPFNDITNSNYATQVQAFDYQGGVKDYFETMMNRLYTFQNAGTMSQSQRQLYRMLVSYKNNWTNWEDEKAGNGRKWDTITAADAINDYFNNSNEFSDEGWDFETDDRLQNIMTELYNIDYDVETNFFFGMEMKMNFMMPKDGMTGNDTNQDGKSDYPMKFIFEGDDDVWVYIDGILFLDLTGIHRHVGGEIDFVNGMVHYYQMESYVDGEVEDIPYYSMSFADILTKIGGVAQADLGKYLKYENGKYTTFKDYSTHDFNFYYMERGSGSSVCRINFNFPLLRKNSVSVTKELSPDADVNIMGNPDYYFNIVTPGNELFVGPNSKTGVTSYTILDSGGNPIGTGETDEYGIFTLKAGQTAVFEGVDENEGEFFVQELIKEADTGQYSEVYVNGEEARYKQLIDWNYRKYFTDSDSDNYTGPYGYKWYGYSGQDTDSSANRAFYFEADNGVNTSALGKLSITKKVETYNGSDDTDKVYKMNVVLDTKLIPIGTKYSILHKDGTTTEKEVTELGCIEIKTGETAIISNILSGTKFTVEEDSGSAKGYTVVYTAQGANPEEVTSDGTGITGIIRNSATVEVLVTNTENGTTLNIPVKKIIDNPDGNEHTFKFKLQEVDQDGKELNPTGKIWEATEAVSESKEFVFALNYFEKDIDSLPVTYYYKLTEVAEENTDIKYDQTEYLIEVKVSKENNELKAEIVDVKKDNSSLKEEGALPDDLSLEFTNILLEDLILEKQLKGTTLDSEKTFKFAVTLKDKDGKPLSGTYKVTDVEGTQDKELNDNGTFEVEVNAGSSITIQGIPLGTLWSITELETEGYLVTRTVKTESTEETNIESVESNEASGTISEQTTVTFVNQTTYELPETGGIGTNPFIIGGLALMCCAMFLLYNNKKRGKEETASS